MNKTLAVSILILGLFVAGMTWSINRPEVSHIEITGEPTDFISIGTVTFKKQGGIMDAAFFAYKEGAQEVSRQLAFDEVSFCTAPNGAEACIALNVPLDFSYGDKRAMLEGITQSDGMILVRKLRRLAAGEEPLMHDAGRVFITWEKARELINACQIKSVIQTHSLDVGLTLLDDHNVITVSPVIDDVFDLVQKAGCQNVMIATE